MTATDLHRSLTRSTVAAGREGDDTHLAVRLAVAPSAGTFEPADDRLDLDRFVAAGTVLGHVVGPGRTDPVVAFCSGRLVRLLADAGERVRPAEPIAWIDPSHPAP